MLQIDMDSQLKDLIVTSDRGRLKQILLNLVTNAYKFTFYGGITITIKLLRMFGGRRKAKIQFSVKDTGVGIKEEDYDKLFKPFGMLEHNNHLNPHGCGIGLTVCKKYLHKLGGDIRVKSKYGEGTVMIFTIP